jgi:hypothetical protein
MKAKKKQTTTTGANVKATQWMVAILIVAACLGATIFLWTFVSAKTQTVSVCMWNGNHAKNSPLNTEAVCEYKMLIGEYEEYALEGTDGVTSRLIKWEDRALLNGRYCTRNTYNATVVVMEDLMDEQVNNKDMLMYNFPGRQIVSLEIGGKDMDAFKGFLVPGDRINITAVIATEKTVLSSQLEEGAEGGAPQTTADLFGDGKNSGKDQEITEEVITTEPLFDSIYIADMLNGDGDSVLDLMERYNALTAQQQAQWSASDAWKEATTPKVLLVALTQEELLRYYKYAERSGVTFRVSLPQR